MAVVAEKIGFPPSPRPSFTGFLKSVKERDHRALHDFYRSDVRKAPMRESSGITGGYIVPIDFGRRLMEVVSEESFLIPRATIVPMASQEALYPRIDAETAQSAGTAPYFGGTLFVWGFEDAPTETEPKFKQTSLIAWDLLGYSVVSNQYLMDAGPVAEQYLINMFGRACAWYMEYAFLQGTGSAMKMPLGVLNAPGAIAYSRAGSGHIVQSDIIGMAAKLLPFGWADAIWACHPSTLADIAKITGYIPNMSANLHNDRSGMGAERGCAGSLLSLPLFVTDKLPALGTKGDLILFSPRLYVIGDRQQIVVDVSEHTLFRNFQTVYRVWVRCDGKPWLDNQVTLADGTATASAYVILT